MLRMTSRMVCSIPFPYERVERNVMRSMTYFTASLSKTCVTESPSLRSKPVD